jgi:polygalacturonase
MKQNLTPKAFQPRSSRPIRALLALAPLGLLVASAPIFAAESDADWAQMDEILKRIVAPTFPDKDFVITEYGAVGDGKKDCRPAITKAIEECSNAGGGRVVLPAGTFLSNGPVHLKSNVNLHIAEGATLLFGTDEKDFLPVVLTRWEGILLYNYSPLIYAKDQENIAVTGKGTIDGNGAEGIRRKFLAARTADNKAGHEASRQELWRLGAAKTPVEKRVFGKGHFLRPGGVEPFECKNVLIEGVTLTNMPFWVVHPIFCTNVTVRDIRIESTTGNNDGVDPDSCKDVLIEGCYFKTGDDAIAIKSGRDQDGWTVGRPSENIVVRNCTFAGRLYGLAIGSEMSGGVRNVFVEDCKAVSGRAAIYTKGNLDRGGVVENVRVRRIQAEKMSEAAVRFESNYHGHRGEHHPPQFRNFVIEDVHCKSSNAYGVYIEGQPETPVTDVVLRNITVDEAKAPLWIHHIKNVRFENVKVNGQPLPETPPLTPKNEQKLNIRD